ncbi:MAG TPA: tetratricopeptide repeat protein [Chthonomonadaceae bacterium]|nr:tetratricopeptide repeat protein [Chthonomonadaceae bacterium]
MWEDALTELKRQSYSPMVKRVQAQWLARIYLGMKNYTAILDLEDQARREGCDIQTFLAVAHARLGHHATALRMAKEAVRVRRQGAAIALGHVYFEAGEYEEALLWYERGAHHLLQRMDVLRAMGKTLMALGDYREAAWAYEQAVRLTPFARGEDLRQLAECLYRIGDRRASEVEALAEEKA